MLLKFRLLMKRKTTCTERRKMLLLKCQTKSPDVLQKFDVEDEEDG